MMQAATKQTDNLFKREWSPPDYQRAVWQLLYHACCAVIFSEFITAGVAVRNIETALMMVWASYTPRALRGLMDNPQNGREALKVLWATSDVY